MNSFCKCSLEKVVHNKQSTGEYHSTILDEEDAIKYLQSNALQSSSAKGKSVNAILDLKNLVELLETNENRDSQASGNDLLTVVEDAYCIEGLGSDVSYSELCSKEGQWKIDSYLNTVDNEAYGFEVLGSEVKTSINAGSKGFSA